MSERNTPIHELFAAVTTGDDDLAESLVAGLDESDEATLLVLTADPDADVRWWAVRSLAQVGSENALPALQHALADEATDVRAAALMTLSLLYSRIALWPEELSANMARSLADDDGLVRQVAGDALTRLGDAAVPALAAVLAANHAGARTRATLSLGKIATMPAAAVLYRYLNDENYLVREYAYEALDEMGLLENQLYLP